MKAMFRALKAALGVAMFATVFASLANAQCVDLGAFKHSALMLRQPFSNRQFTPVAFSLAAENEDVSPLAEVFDPIVGFWKVDFISEGNSGIPDGTVLDAGFAQWHSDGTEIHNRSSSPPRTGNFCLGVWEKTGPSKYKLNHFALGWNIDDTYLGPANIREAITLSPDHSSFVGTFTIDQYDPSGNLLAHVVGQLKGKRITVNTTITEVL